MEAAKEELGNRLANEQLSKPPKVNSEFMTFWLHRFRKLDVTKQSHRKMLIDTFINAIYLYDDKILITFNYKDGTKKITFSDIQEASKRDGFWFGFGLLNCTKKTNGAHNSPKKIPAGARGFFSRERAFQASAFRSFSYFLRSSSVR